MHTHLVKRKRAYRRRFYWELRWIRTAPADKEWANNTSACESHGDPEAHSPNGDHGAFQFKLATARAAGFAGDPHTTSWYEQAVRAVRWRNVAGRGQWPTCG